MNQDLLFIYLLFLVCVLLQILQVYTMKQTIELCIWLLLELKLTHVTVKN